MRFWLCYLFQGVHCKQGTVDHYFVVDKKLNEVDYLIATPESRKKQRLCHLNMLKLYHKRKETLKVMVMAT